FTPSTSTWESPTRASTTPRLVLSLPVRTMTSSPLRILFISRPLQHFRRQRHNLHELLGTQLTRDRSEDTSADGLELGIEQHGRVAAKTDQRTVFTTNALGSANNDCVVDLAFLYTPARRCIFDTNFN